MNKIILEKTIIEANTITYIYSVVGRWKQYFKKSRKYSIKYDYDLTEIPISIANIQFVLNLIPLSWIFDATMELEELDKDCFESITNIKKGYINMYPQIDFNGYLLCNKVVSNKFVQSEKVGLFFSGGLDATSTLASHYKENPILINIQGADISLIFNNVVNEVKKNLKKISSDHDLSITFIKSEFRKVIKEKKVTKHIEDKINDNYWHAFQHGIAIIGHAAPICYIEKLKLVYIAASYTEKTRMPCASDPTIDNCVKIASSSIYHDGFEFDRNDKVKNIINYKMKTNNEIELRVCLDDYRTNNCCHCEKCYRTILNIASQGYDPKLLGFDLAENDYEVMKNEVINKLIFSESCITLWSEIQNQFKNNNSTKIDSRFNWIYDINLKKINDKKKKKIITYFRKQTRRIKKFFTLIESTVYCIFSNK